MFKAVGSKKRAAEEKHTVRISMFGPLRIENESGFVEENRHRQVEYWLLLKYLLVRPGVAVDEDELIRDIWATEAGQLEANSLRVRLNRLRASLAPLHLEKPREGLVNHYQWKFYINPTYDLVLDTDVFDALMGQIQETSADDPKGLELCEKALEIYRGKYFAQTPDYEWLQPHRANYRAAFEALARETLHRMIVLGNDKPLGLLCRRSALIVPEAEELHRSILRYLDDNNKELQKLRHEFQLSSVGGTGPDWLKNLK